MRKARTQAYRAERRCKFQGGWRKCKAERKALGETRSQYDRRKWQERQALLQKDGGI
jgi:hypothetical protein